MGFQAGNGGGNSENSTIKYIPTPKIESLGASKIDRENGILSLRVYSDLQDDTTWRDFNPKIYLFRYKTKKNSKKFRNTGANAGNYDVVIVPARWAHPNLSDGKTSIWDADTTNIIQNQQNTGGLQLRRNGATLVKIVLSEWFRPLEITRTSTTGITTVVKNIQVSRQSNYSNTIDEKIAKNVKRKSEYFKFAYVLEKDGKKYVGEMSTQTVKVKYENSKNGYQFVAKLV